MTAAIKRLIFIAICISQITRYKLITQSPGDPAHQSFFGYDDKDLFSRDAHHVCNDTMKKWTPQLEVALKVVIYRSLA